MLNKPFAFILLIFVCGVHPPIYAHAQYTNGNIDYWSVDPLTLFLLMLSLVLYQVGQFKISHKRMTAKSAHKHRSRKLAFYIGWTVVLIALCSPIDVLGEFLFSAHMVQHELLMLLAAPLLVISRPSSALLNGFPLVVRRGWGAALRSSYISFGWKALVSPTGAWVLHAAGLWVWHLPFLFNASLQDNMVHTLQHFSFLFIALVFWYSIFHCVHNRLLAVLYLFTTALHASALGALITLSPTVWYAPYKETTIRYGLSALHDQQIGGIIMWMPAGIAFIAVGLYLAASYLRRVPFER